MMPMSEEQRKTVKWEPVTKGFMHTGCGVTKIATCRRFPTKDDNRLAVVGYNGMLRGDFVWYTEPIKQGENDKEPIIMRIDGVAPVGIFMLSYLDPPTPEESIKLVQTLPVNCRPAPEFKLGRRLL